MRDRHVRTLSALTTLALVGAILAGCGSSSSKTTTSNATDHAFVQQMIPHHMMAVQMAQTAQRHGDHTQIKALGASIISDQQAEIAEMTPIAKTLGVKPDAMPMGGHMGNQMMSDGHTLGMSMNQMGMSMNTSSLAAARPFDRAFIDMMIPHHQGAVRMAQAELKKGKNPKLRTLARRIISAQDREIFVMSQWRTRWYASASPVGGTPSA